MCQEGSLSLKKIAVLTSKTSWFWAYSKKLVILLRKRRYKAKIFCRHEDIDETFEVVFMLSYFKIISEDFLKKHKHNLVVHESQLPAGRGWAPLFWQILERKNSIPIVLLEANKDADDGPIYIKNNIFLSGYELYNEIRRKQAEKTIELCLRFLSEYKRLKPLQQFGKPAFYRRRNPFDSRLDINKSIKDQFNLLRIVDNEEFPAFFKHKGKTYILKIFLKNNRL